MKRSTVVVGASALVLLIIGGIAYRMRSVKGDISAPTTITSAAAPIISSGAASMPITSAGGIKQQVPLSKSQTKEAKKAAKNAGKPNRQGGRHGQA